MPNLNKNHDNADASHRPIATRPVIAGTNGVISSGHHLTSMAGMRMLLSGGNAFDAIVASVFAAAVVEPIAAYSLGAESVFMLYHEGSNEILSLSGQGVAPAVATTDFYRSRGLKTIPTGPGQLAPLSFTVPGVVHAALSLLELYGTKTVGEVLEPAIQYAGQGIPHYDYMIKALMNPSFREQFDTFPPGGTDIFYDDGDLPKVGSKLIQNELCAILQTIVSTESSANCSRVQGIQAARDEFYKGSVARIIANCSKSVGGTLEFGDLAQYRSKFEKPLSTTFRGYEICVQPTWSQAAVLLIALNILEQFDLEALGHNSSTYIHIVVEALKLALADREAYFGDPDFVAVPTDGLLSKNYARERATLIDVRRAYPELPEPGDPWFHSKFTKPAALVNLVPSVQDLDIDSDDQGTTHISVADRTGNMICATPSGGAFPKSVFFPELGFTLSTRMEMFNLIEGHPNVVEPAKRPRTTLVNYIAMRDGKAEMTFGCPGGDHQVQANLQLILNSIVFGMDPQSSIESPRFATDTLINSFHPHVYQPGQLSVEEDIPQLVLKDLISLGHKIVRKDVCGMGATVTHNDFDTGVLSTGADPRRTCYALGW